MHHRLNLVAALAAALAVPAAAQAAPVTVNLRVEGPTKTVFEGRVTTDVRTFHFTNETATHRCDATAASSGTSPVPVPVRNGALITAAEQKGFALVGTFGTFGATFTQVGSEKTAFDPATSKFLAEYKNNQFAQIGGCADPIADNDNVLYAYGDGTEPLLGLTGPATAAPGAAITVRVTAGGQPVAGASVAGVQTRADGTATIRGFAQRGAHGVKASKPGTIRSNRLTVCVTDRRDGFCKSRDRLAPKARVVSIRDGRVFAKGKGPRRLAGVVGTEPSGLKSVELRLTRNDRGSCTTYDAQRRAFVATRRCAASAGRWFTIGRRAAWSYTVPSRLPRGRYVLDARATDRAGNTETVLQRKRNRVAFTVR